MSKVSKATQRRMDPMDLEDGDFDWVRDSRRLLKLRLYVVQDFYVMKTPDQISPKGEYWLPNFRYTWMQEPK